jgi:uncharacterized phage-associated protein
MFIKFNPIRTLQAAAALLKMEPDHRMNYMRLLKLLYIADREMLAQHAQPITGDRAVAMKRGPVLSRTYDLIRGTQSEAAPWGRYLRKEHYNVVLTEDPGEGKLSKAILQKLQEVYDRYSELDEWDMVEETHKLEEWKKNFPEGSTSCHEIPWEDALQAQHKPELIAEVEKDERASDLFDQIFGR